MSNFRSRIALTIKGDRFVLLEDLAYQGNQQRFTVPAGFTTDLASTPWFAGWLIGKVSQARDGAGILHDYLYGTQPSGVSRKDADRLFLRVMIEDGAYLWRAGLMYLAVRLFGWRYWRRR